ncbi:3D domain-containing protein [Zobellia roscoffensis]|uniref:3D domain-containing protein n=1 Tax=Zobellia roscoffensis TaxID=2779508 RepID=UPI00188BA984|nr:3D domain-containing protein [Zobellia roscoffensis]
MFNKITAFLLLALLYNACAKKNDYVWKTKEVNVSAYNSVHWQTDGEPSVAAWGDTLKPGMKIIAISRDLMKLGFEPGTQVKIHGLEGIYEVRDKMHSRWNNKIDVFMGSDVQKARDWGMKKIEIKYRVKREDNTQSE